MTTKATSSDSSRVLAHLAILFVVACEAYAVITFSDLFPFSPNPMFAYPQHSFSATVMNAYAVAEDGREINLMTSDPTPHTFPASATPYTFPLDGRLMQWSFERMYAREKPSLEVALRDLLERYRIGRERGRHDGPPIRAVRLYRETWTLRFSADNRDTPDTRELLAEVTAEAAP